jgi:hypothetical protein
MKSWREISGEFDETIVSFILCGDAGVHGIRSN